MRIAWITDMDRKASGYGNLSLPLIRGLHDRGHKMYVLGHDYRGEPHDHPFAIIPAHMTTIGKMCANLTHLKAIDAIVCSLDLWMQEQFLVQPWRRDVRYVGIFPIEGDPLSMSWAMLAHMMDERLVLSQFGVEQMAAAGIKAKFLPISVSTKQWRKPAPEERSEIRKHMGAEGKFVVLTVAENQERKHLSRTMEIFAKFAQTHDALQWIVTTSRCPVGWNLSDLSAEFGLQDKVSVIEKGLPAQNLWGLYAAADAFLLTSKAEGLGMCLLEAMSCGLPVAATDCTAITEVLADGRGFPIHPDYIHRDPFGNCRRYFASIDAGAEALERIASLTEEERAAMAEKTKQYVLDRGAMGTISILEGAVTGGKK